jgi:hypothetical protein
MGKIFNGREYFAFTPNQQPEFRAPTRWREEPV